jgi:Tol biopolymer transport system component/CheY-like chemotaxis protein
MEAESALQGLEVLAHTPVDAVIMELAHPASSGAHLVIASTHTLEANVRKAIEFGVSDYLVKPFQPTDVERRLSALIQRVEKNRRLQADAESAAEKQRVLVADNDLNFCSFAASTPAGSYEIKQAASSLEILAQIHTWNPDLLLLNPALRGLNLEFLLDRLGAIPNSERIQIYLLVGVAVAPQPGFDLRRGRPTRAAGGSGLGPDGPERSGWLAVTVAPRPQSVAGRSTRRPGWFGPQRCRGGWGRALVPRSARLAGPPLRLGPLSPEHDTLTTDCSRPARHRGGRGRGPPLAFRETLDRLVRPSCTGRGRERQLAYASDRANEGHLDIWVRQVAGREPLRLTSDPADDHEPSFSPDGSEIAFRSEREPGGVHVVPVLGVLVGGQPRLLAAQGRNPRYSPDGKWIAYWIGNAHANSRMGIVPAAGGPARNFDFGRPELSAARYPVWSPDGSRVLFMGHYDWWVAVVATGEAAPTGAGDVFRRHAQPMPLVEVPSAWVGDRILFHPAAQEAASLWQIPISLQNWRITGAPERLTFTTGLDTSPSLAAGGRLAFASLAENVDLWSLAIDPNRAGPAGKLSRLTDAAGADLHPSISSDGRRMVFRSNRSGAWDVWIKDLETGQESTLITGMATASFTSLTHDGSKAAYQERVDFADGNHYLVEIGPEADRAPPKRYARDAARSRTCRGMDNCCSTTRSPRAARSLRCRSPPGRCPRH